MAIRADAEIPQATAIAMVWVTLCLAGAVLVDLAGVGSLSPPLTGPETEKVFIRLALLLFHPLVAGVLLAAILAAIMSTASAQLLVASSALSEDFYKTFWRSAVSPRKRLWVGRAAVLVISVIAYWLAMDPTSKVLDLVAYAWAGFGAAFGPAILLSLFWRRMTRGGAMAGIVTGGSVVVIWTHLGGGVFDLYELVPGFFLSALAIVVVSLAGRSPGPEIREQFDAATGVTKARSGA
jgi:sodium/proline symporter